MKRILILAFILTAISGVSSAQFWKLKVADECIPKDFDPEKYTLLVVHLPNRNNPEKTSEYATKNLRQALEKNYPYKFVIVTPAEMRDENSPYKDTSIYRFMLLNSINTTPRSDGGYTKNLRTGIITPNSPHRVQTTTVDFSFYDLGTDTQYPFMGANNSNLNATIKPMTEAVNKVSGRSKQ
jgi:hypothetical protein